MTKWSIAILLLAALAGRMAAGATCTTSSPVGLPCTTGAITYDGARNISAIGNDTFTYDPLNRLTAATLQSAGGTGQTYSYDTVGNLKKITYTQNGAPTTSFVDNNPAAATNHLAAASYDDAGNVTGVSGMTFDYDASGMATSASAGSGHTLEIYTADDERIGAMQVSVPVANTKINLKPYVATWRIRGIAPQVLRELKEAAPAGGAATWTWTRDWAYRGSQLFAEMLSSGTNSERWWHYHIDHLGTPRLITDESGSMISAHNYYPFGEEITSIIGQTEVTKFTGHERDFLGETITENKAYVDYMHARYAAPLTGRFLSLDPALGRFEAPQSWNRYAYTQNNPLRYTDPTGMYTNSCPPADTQCNDQMKLFEAARQKSLCSKNPFVVAAAKAYGDPDTPNGVTVKFGNVTAGEEGTATVHIVGDVATAELKYSAEVTIKNGTTGLDLQQVVAHEGSHVEDGNNLWESFSGYQYNPSLAFTSFETEVKAYRISAWIAAENGSTLSFKKDKTSYVITPKMKQQDVDVVILQMLADPKFGYGQGRGVTPSDQGLSQSGW